MGGEDGRIFKWSDSQEADPVRVRVRGNRSWTMWHHLGCEMAFGH